VHYVHTILQDIDI